LSLLILMTSACLESQLEFRVGLDPNAPPKTPFVPAEPQIPDILNSQTCKGYSSKFSRRVWRLTPSQYVNAVQSAFPGTTGIGNPFEGSFASGPFNNNADGLQMSTPLSEKLFLEAKKISLQVAPKLGTSYPCLSKTLTDPCIDEMVNDLGFKLFRRPLALAETIEFSNFYKTSLEKHGSSAAEMLIQAMLISPHFVFRYEIGDRSTGLLSGFEKASLISFSAANTSPDSVLLEAAANNQLNSHEQIKAQFVRMARKSGKYEMVIDLFRQYLNYDYVAAQAKDASQFPSFSKAVAETLVKETDALIVDIMNADGGTFQKLLSTDTVKVSPSTAHIYGVNASGKSGMFTAQVDNRAGLLTQPSFIASVATPRRTSPVSIGRKIRFSLLCTPVPAPPPDVVSLDAAVKDPNKIYTQRELLAVHNAPNCISCHKFMDPIGLGFEGFDAVGAKRTHEAGFIVDDSGAIDYTGTSIDGPFYGAVEVAQRLSESELVEACFMRNTFLYIGGQTQKEGADCFVQKAKSSIQEGEDLVQVLGSLFATYLLEPRQGDLEDYSHTPAKRVSIPTTTPPPPPPPTSYPPPAPKFVSAPANNSSFSANSVTITWSGGTGIYLVRATKDGVRIQTSNNDNYRSQSFTINSANIQKGSSYSFWVHSRKENFSYNDPTSFGASIRVDFKISN
jgi:hypothetical protein